jgi:hypothetical protein
MTAIEIYNQMLDETHPAALSDDYIEELWNLAQQQAAQQPGEADAAPAELEVCEHGFTSSCPENCN